ncbi:MAG: hypothetical protein C0498_01450 [Anaerolinea sp.]|nr:hypothetical protein [Anaerolinea sp.]
MRDAVIDCETCQQVDSVGGDLRAVGREIARLQAAFAPLAKDYRRLRLAHPRCAACGVLVGPTHHEQQLAPEPMRPRARGQKRYDVCASCYRRLHAARRSVPQQRAYEVSQAELLGDDAGAEDDVDAGGLAAAPNRT